MTLLLPLGNALAILSGIAGWCMHTVVVHDRQRWSTDAGLELCVVSRCCHQAGIVVESILVAGLLSTHSHTAASVVVHIVVVMVVVPAKVILEPTGREGKEVVVRLVEGRAVVVVYCLLRIVVVHHQVVADLREERDERRLAVALD